MTFRDTAPRYMYSIAFILLSLNVGTLAPHDAEINFAAGEPVRAEDIPVKVTRSKSPGSDGPVALFFSGDGGWYSFEEKISEKLSEMGISTLGIDSKKYFWKRKTPGEAASDMTELINHYSMEWGKNRIILIGYSLGAEIVPFIVNRLPEELRSRVFSSILLSPGISTDFEIHVSNMLGMGNKQNTYDVPGEIRKMQPVRTLIIYGSGEKSEVPALLEGSGVMIRMIPGDHHYKFDIPLIIKTMKENETL